MTPSDRFQGAKRLIGMVGQDIGTAKSPEIFNRWFRAHDLDIRMARYEVAPGELPSFLSTFRASPDMVGLVVTMPHKAAVAARLDHRSVEVERFAVANAVRKTPTGELEGGMFDGHAFDVAFGGGVASRSVGVVGSGAAGLVGAWRALAAGASALSLLDIDPARVAAASDRLRNAFPGAAIGQEVSACDIWINASPVGSRASDPSPLPSEALARASLVLDLAAGASPSRLLLDAHDAGARTVDGRAFAEAQFEPLRRFLLATADA